MNSRLCELKDQLINISLRLTKQAPYRIPAFRFEVDKLVCPNRDHCNPSGPCRAWRDPAIRQRVARIEDQLFVLGFTRADETFERSKP